MGEFNDAQLRQLRGVIQDAVKEAVHDETTDLCNSVIKLTTDFSTLTTDVAKLTTCYSSMDKALGIIAEEAFRSKVSKEYGESFSRQFTFYTLFDLARFMLEGNGLRSLDQAVFQATSTLATAILDGSVLERYLRELFAALTAAAGLGPDLVHPDLLALGAVAQEFACISADGIVNMSSVGPFIGALRSRYPEQHKRLISLLGCICKVLASPDRVKALLEAGEDGSLGIAMAQVAAHPEPYVRELRAYADLPIPAGVVQCDMRGMIQVYTDKAVIKVGEFKRSTKMYGDAVKQVLTRLRLFAWAVKTHQPSIKSLVLVGHLFFPKDEASQAESKVVDDMHIHVHRM